MKIKRTNIIIITILIVYEYIIFIIIINRKLNTWIDIWLGIFFLTYKVMTYDMSLYHHKTCLSHKTDFSKTLKEMWIMFKNTWNNESIQAMKLFFYPDHDNSMQTNTYANQTYYFFYWHAFEKIKHVVVLGKTECTSTKLCSAFKTTLIGYGGMNKLLLIFYIYDSVITNI